MGQFFFRPNSKTRALIWELFCNVKINFEHYYVNSTFSLKVTIKYHKSKEITKESFISKTPAKCLPLFVLVTYKANLLYDLSCATSINIKWPMN